MLGGGLLYADDQGLNNRQVEELLDKFPMWKQDLDSRDTSQIGRRKF